MTGFVDYVVGNPRIYTGSSELFAGIQSFGNEAFLTFRDSFWYYFMQGMNYENMYLLSLLFASMIILGFACYWVFGWILMNGPQISSSSDGSSWTYRRSGKRDSGFDTFTRVGGKVKHDYYQGSLF